MWASVCEFSIEAAASDSEIHLVAPVFFFQGPLHPIVQTDLFIKHAKKLKGW